MSYLKLLGQLRRTLKDDTVSLFYHGIFDDDFTDKFISIIAFDSERKVRGKMAFVMAESFQNVIRHKDETLDLNNTNTFGIRGRTEWMHIFSSNLVNNEVRNLLEAQLSDINSYDQHQLKEAYIAVLSKGELSDKGGAGLGLIEMARKSNNPIQYKFNAVSADTYAFNMQVDFVRGTEEPVQPNLSIQENLLLNERIIEEDILFIYNGEFSDDVLLPMIPIVETNAAVEGTLGYSIFHIAIELMQNIGRHGSSGDEGFKTGLFAVKKLPGGYYICSGNYTKADLSELKNYVLELNLMENDELNELYKKALKESVATNVNNARVGLIDIRRTAGNPIDVEISEDEKGKYLMIGVKIAL